MIRVLLLVIGYCLGMIQTGYLYGRMKGIDIRKAGSGNSGATNSLRVLGKKAGLIVFVVDLCKCFIPCLIVKAWAVSSGQQHMEDIYKPQEYQVEGGELTLTLPTTSAIVLVEVVPEEEKEEKTEQ